MPAYTFINAKTAWSMVGDGATDNYPLVKAGFQSLQANTAIYIPAGNYKFSRPPEIGSDYTLLYGDGPATQLSIYENAYYMPALGYGVRTVEGSAISRAVTRSYRPDMFGVMDSGWAGAANARWGFRTNGDAVVRLYAGPGSIGALSADSAAHGGRLFDYWGEATGVTVRVCLFLTATSIAQMRTDPHGNGANIIGLGDIVDPGPWKLGTDSGNPANFFFALRTSEMPCESGSPYRSFRFAIPTTGGRAVTGGVIHDVEAYASFVDGSFGARVNNVAATVLNPSNMAGLAGKHFAKNRGYDFTIGPNQNATIFNFAWGPVPDYGVYAFNVLRSAKLAGANNDTSRYGSDVDSVVCSDLTESAADSLERTLKYKCGACVPFDGTAGRLFHTNADLGFIKRGCIRDLAVIGSLGLGTFNHLDVVRVDAGNGIRGVEHYNTGTAYTLNLDGGQYGGFDVAIDLSQVIARMAGVRVQGMGDAALRLRACNVLSDGLFVAGFSNGGRAVVDMLNGPTNGIYTFNHSQFDQEGYTFTDPDGDGGAVFKIDMHTSSTNTVLNVHGLQQDSSGSTAAVFLLRGARGSSSLGGVINVSGIQVGPNNGRLVKATSPDWSGTVDTRRLSVPTIEGDAASVAAIKLAGATGGPSSQGFPEAGV